MNAAYPSSNGRPSTPWDIDVAHVVKAGVSLEDARDVVASHWLHRGDARALAAFLLDGHVPGQRLYRLLAWMFVGPDNSKTLPPNLAELTPYQFVLKRRSGRRGRAVNPETQTRDRLLAINMKALMDERGLTYEKAALHLQNWATETGARIEIKTITNAYDARFGKKTRNRKKNRI